jgi:hypothetical protein
MKPGELQDYCTRKSMEAQRLSGIQGRLSNGVSEWAKKWALPDDLMHRYGKKKDDATSEEESDDNKKGNEEDSNTIMSSRRNYYKVFDQKSKVRKHMEETARWAK